MSPPEQAIPRGIGSALKEARRKIGMDVKEAEERTKIRARYLRALEAEDWEILPAPAYVRGFLRTYGDLVGLDGAMLADEFRRRHEESAGAANAALEPVLQERRRAPGSRPPSRGPLIAGIAIAIVVLLVILGSLGSDDEPSALVEKPSKASLKGDEKGSSRGGPKGGTAAAELVPVDLTVEPIDSIEICLVAGTDEALVDAQVLAPGAVEQFGDVKNYRLDLGSAGAVRLTVGGDSRRIESAGTASFEADSEGIREVDYAGPDCP